MRRMPILLLALSAAAAAAEPTPPPALDGLLIDPHLWQTDAATIEARSAPLGFAWTSAAKEALRAGAGLFASQPVCEAVLRFEAGKPAGAVVLFYNRGDAGDLREDEFRLLVESTRADLDRLFGTPGTPRGRDASSAVRAEGLTWTSPARSATLEWSATKESRTKGIPFRAEFLRLKLEPTATGQPRVGATPPPTTKEIVKAFRGRDQVRKGETGEIFLDGIPMVDQGEKGYCVVASVERVLRYYGAQVDQHELAQLAGTSAAAGTSPEAMIEALKALTMRFGIRVRDVLPFNFTDFLEMVEDYNRLAKRAKEPPVDIGGRIVDIAACYRQMKPEILRQVRAREQAGFGKFQREIAKSIGEGIPLLWSVQLGVVPEPGLPQAWGGHMRLIVGHDPRTGDVIYSDSWGAGHESKRMSAEDAWLITTGLGTVQPSGA